MEVLIDGRFGLICDDHWELEDAHVVCRQLGFRKLAVTPVFAHALSFFNQMFPRYSILSVFNCRGALAAVGGGAYGTGDFTAVDIVMDEVHCGGTETDIRECKYAAVHDCDVNEAASVQCIPNEG